LLDCLRALSSDQFDRFKTGTIKPRAASSSQQKPSLEITGAHQAAKRVLLVEDMPTNQIVATIELQRLGLDVTTACNGEEALALLAEFTFELVFMDCQMPVMDGYEATQAIRKRERTTGNRVPIVAMTANALEGDRDKCLEAGMDDYITKPFNPDDLRATVERWLTLETVATDGQAEPATDSATQEVVLDYEKLKSRYTAPQCEQLLSAFVSDTRSKLTQLESLVEQRDLTAVGKLAHGIKGAASMLFADELTQAALDLELAAKKGDETANYAELSNRVQARFGRLSKTVEGLLS
jgi:CheY-like chemotaxis protein/HPt (histidine-containing phosphotransfer) domain-containing protein